MNPIQPEQALFLLQLALPAAKNEHRTTRSVIEAIPADNGDYRPDPISKSAMELAWHIVAAEHRFYSGIVAGQFDFAPNHRPESVRTPADIGQWYGSSFSKNFEKLSALQPGQSLQTNRFSRLVATTRRRLLRVFVAALHSSSRPIVRILARHGRQSSRHLRGKLRLRRSQEGCAGRLSKRCGRKNPREIPRSQTPFGMTNGSFWPALGCVFLLTVFLILATLR